MKTMNLRDANQQFSKLVREVEESGEAVTILRNGKPAVRVTAVETTPAERTPAQRAALARLLDPKNHFTSKAKVDIEEIRDEAMNRMTSVRGVPDRAGLRKAKYSRGLV